MKTFPTPGMNIDRQNEIVALNVSSGAEAFQSGEHDDAEDCVWAWGSNARDMALAENCDPEIASCIAHATREALAADLGVEI